MNGGSQSGDRLQEAASDIVDQASRTADAQASTTMTKAGDVLDQVARSVRDAGNGLREQQPDIARMVDTAAERVESASSYLRDHNASDVLQQAQDFARRQPAVVIGGGLALGVLLGRLLKSGSSQGGNQWSQGRYGRAYDDQGYGRQGYGAQGYGAEGYGSEGYGRSTSYSGYGAGTTAGVGTESGYDPSYGTSGYDTGVGTGSGTGSDYTTGGSDLTGGDLATSDLAGEDLETTPNRGSTGTGEDAGTLG